MKYVICTLTCNSKMYYTKSECLWKIFKACNLNALQCYFKNIYFNRIFMQQFSYCFTYILYKIFRKCFIENLIYQNQTFFIWLKNNHIFVYLKPQAKCAFYLPIFWIFKILKYISKYKLCVQMSCSCVPLSNTVILVEIKRIVQIKTWK